MDIKRMFNESKYECICKICKKVFVVANLWESRRRVLCGSDKCKNEDRRLAMKRYRATDEGKKAVKLQNMRYKREDIEKKCEACGEIFKTARKRRYICNKVECKSRGVQIRQKKYREGNREKSRARNMVGKRISRGVSINREPCIVCGCSESESHHHDYKRPLDVNFLCSNHHQEIHTWDSN